ncbi:ABC transporter ATPase [Rubrolithibacter danxiaensis]|uniref:ABC transporter ATPase n=1 Tax=Rubrolithibacter danxiaensis TaxID=3390805 RepID=UPI003BF8BA29
MNISENSRVWIYQSDRALTALEEEKIAQILTSFTDEWQAHGQQLAATFEIRYHRFIILIVDENNAGASGCSIDSSVKLIKKIEKEFNLNLFDRFNIAYKTEGAVKSCPREEFETLISSGIVTENTIVFNNLVQTFADLNSKWEIPFKDSWHASLFGKLLPS